jgi:hypothetical protein
MRKSILIALAVAMVVALGATAAVVGSEGQPASKATAVVGDVSILDSGDMGWTTILDNTIKTGGQKDLFIDVSLECGLYTKTKVKSKGNVADTSTANAVVKVKVLVDTEEAYPGEVVFCSREQELTAEFAGYFNGETTVNETLELVLDTMTANSFNFIIDDLDSGEHEVEVQAMIDVSEAVADKTEAYATIGNGSVTIEEVRMIQDEDILLE